MRPIATFAVATAACALLLVAVPAPGAFAPPAEGTRSAVAADHAQAVRAGLDALQGGGNAVDGAVAAALALGVVSPSASGLGGGGFALVYLAKSRELVALDFRETAPAAVDATALVHDDPRGPAVGVPGEPAGLEHMVVHWGKRSLAADAAFALGLAAHGFPAGQHLSSVLAALPDRARQVSAGLPELLPGGNPLPFRSLVRRPDLARTLARFGTEGARPFYRGDLAREIAAAVRADGGAMTAEDLADYRVQERAPLVRTFGARTIATMPAPSGGGLMLLEAATMYGADATSPLHAMGFGSSAYLHTLAEMMRGALADRLLSAGDPDLDPGVGAAVDAKLAPARLAARRALIRPDRTQPMAVLDGREQGTSHLVVADAEGNVVSLTTTINMPLGSRIVPPGTGIVLNDELTDFTRPTEYSNYGGIGAGPNRARGKARPVSSMTPAIVLEGGQPVLALGGSGGRRIATGVVQAALARLVFGLDPGACASAPRIFTNGPELYVEPEVAEDVRAGLRARGEILADEPAHLSAIQVVAWDRSGPAPRIFAASDPRKAGFAAAQ